MEETIQQLLEKRNENRDALRGGRCSLREYMDTDSQIMFEMYQAMNGLDLGLSGVEEATAKIGLVADILFPEQRGESIVF